MNLQLLLVRSKFSDDQNITVSKCGRKKCTTYKQIMVGNSFNFKGNAQHFLVKHNMDCNSRFVLHVLTCQGCGENYIGETRKKLREKNDHTRAAYTEQRIPHSRHNARPTIKFTVFPFYKMTHENDNARRAKEQYFIKKNSSLLNST